MTQDMCVSPRSGLLLTGLQRRAQVWVGALPARIYKNIAGKIKGNETKERNGHGVGEMGEIQLTLRLHGHTQSSQNHEPTDVFLHCRIIVACMSHLRH